MRLFCVAVFLFSSLARAETISVNSVAAIVNDEVISIFDLKQEIYLIRVYKGDKWDAPIDRDDLRASLQEVIYKWLIAQESVRFNVTSVGEEDVEKRVAGLRRLFRSPGEYDRFLSMGRFTTDRLRDLVVRDIHRDRFLDIKMASMQIEHTEQEILSYYRSHIRRYKSRKFEDVRKEVEAELKGPYRERAKRRWLLDLGARSDIKHVLK